MRYTVVMIILITSVSASSFIAGKSVEEREQQKLQKREIEKIILANTDVIQQSSTVFKRLKKNTDTLMRYSHFLRGHNPSVKRIPFCPECFKDTPPPKGAEKYFTTEFEEHLEEVPETFEQLQKDCLELRNSMKTIATSLHAQSITIERQLDTLRKREQLLKDVEKIISKELTKGDQ